MSGEFYAEVLRVYRVGGGKAFEDEVKHLVAR